MGVPGRRPTGQPTRDRNPRVHEWTEVPDVPYAGALDLPARGHDEWPSRTLAKWAAWSSMPHCALWTPSDWDSALDSLEIAARFHEGDTKLASELRLREKRLGVTFEDRMSLRIRYAPVVDGPPAEVKQLDDYRDL